MKKASIILKITMLICFVFKFNVHAQTFEEENAKVMARMDTESFKEKVLLNKAITLDYLIEPFRNWKKNKEGAYKTYLAPGQIGHLIDLGERGQMDQKKKPEAIDKIQKRSRKEITASNIIPIGIINMDAILLTEAQVEQNIKTKSEDKKADASKYENIEFIAAGLLQDEIFQG